ncbi:MAG: discoidin domain-containing protein [Kiritimatiellae bacterium]|nr:discoidin domain-containing protein [Kiritimatiellia bacterium]
MHMRSVGLAGLLVFASSAGAMTLSSEKFSVELDPAFPGVRSCSFAGETMTLGGNARPVAIINGEERIPTSKLIAVSADVADYQLDFEDISVGMTVRFQAHPDALEITVREIQETGSVAVRTLELPGLVLIAGAADDEVALGNFPAASYASNKSEDRDFITTVAALEFADNVENKTKNRDPNGHRGVSYAFLGTGRLAAGVYSNVLQENLRMIVQMREGEAGRTLTVAPGMWTWREAPGQTEELPRAFLVLAGDRNGDGNADWQDAAIAYRARAPRPYGGEITCRYPITHIAMNFGSQATHPFLRVLDNAKKIWLYTDGLGQRIQFKGYQSEGHDSSHPDYGGNVGRKMGGREELNFVMRRGHDFNVLSGVHINAHEYHLEAKNFHPDLVDMDAVGWSWLDESYLTDYRYDTIYGTLEKRLDSMREDLPWLDFVYLDVYYGRGWPGWRMHRKTNALGLYQFTEFPGVMERAVIWNHVANDWTQAIGGTGDRSAIARFVHYSQKDTFLHEPLLRGSNCDGFMGWHAERNMPQTVRSAFTVNLPTKFLQHFELLRATDQEAFFSQGVRTEVMPDAATTSQVARIYGRDGQLINSSRYVDPKKRPENCVSFIPWDPCAETKIYHWNDDGGDTTWDLPRSWAGIAVATLYRLTDLGRVYEREVAIADGRVTLTGIEPKTPYVLYRQPAPALPEIVWGEGGFVRDPGFDSHSFDAWTPADPAAVAIENHADTGQTELVFSQAKPGAVRQTIQGLRPGQTYAASVWASIAGKREASLSVEPAASSALNELDKQAWKIVSSTRRNGSDRARQVLDGNPQTLWHTASGENAPEFPHEITIRFERSRTLEGFIQTAREGLGNGTIKEYDAWVSVDGKRWQKVAQGAFSYANGPRETVRFAQPVPATYFRLVSKSERSGGKFTSIAELDMIFTPDPLPGKFAPLSRTITRTALTNWTDQSSKYERPWHRLKLVFQAPPSGRADLVLRAGPGVEDAAVRFDDVRLVETQVSPPPKGSRRVVLYEDFENVDEGWGPFMYGWKGPMNTHFSEAHPPYTRDTIGGTYSLKSRKEDSPGMLYRTVPATLALKPNTRYRVGFDYLCDTAEFSQFVAGVDGEAGEEIVFRKSIPNGAWETNNLRAEFRTDARPGWFVGISKVQKETLGTLVIDHVLIEEMP